MEQEVPILLAATVLCTRHNEHNELEVLLLRRNRKLSFASGFWVFPGGKIDKEDYDQSGAEINAALNAAVREAKEEANLNISESELFHYMKWTTPKPSNKRFRTWFFACHLREDQTNITIDDSEIKEYRWLTPQNALSTIGITDVRILPPTFLSLVRISECQTFDEIKKEYNRGPLLDVHPRTGIIDGIFQSMYPGDAGYDSHDVNKEGARHRITGNLDTGTYGFQYHGCDDFFPVNGGYTW